MRRAWVILIAAVLALAGCKGTDTKSGDDKKLPGGVAKGGKKDKEKDAKPTSGPEAWLDGAAKLPGAGTGIPKGGKGDPKDPGFDAKAAAQDALGGRVLDPDGKPARDIFVSIKSVATPGATPLGIYTKPDGYFFATGFKPGQSYEVVAEATTQDGKKLSGVVQTKVPNPILLIVLRDDLPRPGGADSVFPPEPRPSDKVGDGLPPGGAAPKSKDGAWRPDGPVTGVPPATIGGTKPPATGGASGGIPDPADLTPAPSPKPVKPENIADGGPKEPFKPPAVNIPGGPPVPPLPKLPPPVSPPGGSSMRDGTPGGLTGANANKLVLIDTLERPWELDSVRPGSLVLVEFISSTCTPCKQFIPVMKDYQSRYGASGLQVAAVLCDDLPQKTRIATASKYGRDHNLNYAVYVEPGEAGGVRDRFDVEGYPHAVLLNSAGKVLWKGHPGQKEKLESAIKHHLGK
jgi:thiol-disulfide isomerase/thioredoxin